MLSKKTRKFRGITNYSPLTHIRQLYEQQAENDYGFIVKTNDARS